MMLSFDDKRVSVGLLVFISVLSIVHLNKSFVGMEILDFMLESKDFDVRDDMINLNSLTLRQKIGQMIFSVAKKENRDLLQKMNIGGIYFGERRSEREYIEEIGYFQKNMEIPFFIGSDLEGCWNPFSAFKNFTIFKDIRDEDEAYKLGIEHGKELRKLGFNINFAPVVDIEDKIWDCRSFKKDVGRKGVYYIRGLQYQGVIATAKHYPGKTLVGRDPHSYVEFALIEEEDLMPFKLAVENGVNAIMINHLITKGEVDSMFEPSVTSDNVIFDLKKDFNGLVLSDEVNMMGLKDFYGDERRMYIELVNAGNDVLLDFNSDPWHIYRVIGIIESSVKNGEIREEVINEAVSKLLRMKGFKVKRKF